MEKFYIMVNGEQQGPFTAQEIINKGFSNDSYIFNKGLGDWKKISEVEVQFFLLLRKRMISNPKQHQTLYQFLDTNQTKVSEKKGMKRGFLTGLLAFVIAKITHLAVGFVLGFFLVLVFGYTKSVKRIAEFIDNPIIGIIILIFLTRYIYFRLINKK